MVTAQHDKIIDIVQDILSSHSELRFGQIIACAVIKET